MLLDNESKSKTWKIAFLPLLEVIKCNVILKIKTPPMFQCGVHKCRSLLHTLLVPADLGRRVVEIQNAAITE